MSHLRVRYMSQARATIEPLEYAVSACHNVLKKGGQNGTKEDDGERFCGNL